MSLSHRVSPGRPAAVAALLGAMACSGCSSPGDVRTEAAVVSPTKAIERSRSASTSRAEIELRRGIESYEDAEYEIAVRRLRSALDRGLKSPADKATAYKYLAFVACTSGRMKSCHAEFRNALQVDPRFDLAPAEAGHPIWGKVFRNAKLEVTGIAKTR